LEELKDTEIKLLETVAALLEQQDLSSVIENYRRSVVESVVNMLKGLDELEDNVKSTLLLLLYLE